MARIKRHLHQSNFKNYLGLPINANEENHVYEEIIAKTYQELTKLIARHTRSVIIRLDLIPDNDNAHEIDMTRFCRAFKRMLEQKYKSEVVYQWVREYGDDPYNKGLHWHIWVGVKNLTNVLPHTQAKNMHELIAKKWAEIAGLSPRTQSNNWFYLQRDKLSIEARIEEQKLISEDERGVLINLEKLITRQSNSGIVLGGVIDECFFALSYLAKVKTKVGKSEFKGKRLSAASNLSTRGLAAKRKIEVESQLQNIQNHLDSKIEPIPINSIVVKEYFDKFTARLELQKQKTKQKRIEDWKKKKRI